MQFKEIQKQIAQYVALKRSWRDKERHANDGNAVLYEYRARIVRGSKNTLADDAEINWLAQYIKRDEYNQLFGGFLCTGEFPITEPEPKSNSYGIARQGGFHHSNQSLWC